MENHPTAPHRRRPDDGSKGQPRIGPGSKEKDSGKPRKMDRRNTIAISTKGEGEVHVCVFVIVATERGVTRIRRMVIRKLFVRIKGKGIIVGMDDWVWCSGKY